MALVFVLLLVSCRALLEMEPDVCGNGVVESGEECDRFVPENVTTAGVVCGAAESGRRACRFTCSSIDPTTAKEISNPCPTGWACGSDGLCRFPSASYEEIDGSPFNIAASPITLGDVDGDEETDLIVGASDLISVHFGLGEERFTEPLDVGTGFGAGYFELNDLNGDSRTDLLAPTRKGINVLLGHERRRFSPQVHPMVTIDRNTHIFFAESDRCYVDDRLVAARIEGEHLIVLVPDQQSASPAAVAVGSGTALVERFPVADIDGQPGEEIAVPVIGMSSLPIFRVSTSTPCEQMALRVDLVAQVSVAAGAVIDKGALFADVDGDGRQDVMMSVVAAGQEHVQVALQRSDGTFRPAVEDVRFTEVPRVAGQFTADRIADYVVGARLVIASVRTTTPTIDGSLITAFEVDSPFEQAEVGDFNGDGRVDVAASSAQENRLQLLLGDGTGRFIRISIVTEAPPKLLRAADYDGDFVDDLAVVSERHDEAPIHILYGSRSGVPSDKRAMGTLAQVGHMEPGRFTMVRGLDVRQDLLIQTPGPENTDLATVLFGSADRMMLSPLLVPDTFAVGAGQFDSQPGPDLLLLYRKGSAGHLGFLPGREGAPFDVADLQELPLGACDQLSITPSCLRSTTGVVDSIGTEGMVVLDGAVSCAESLHQICVISVEADQVATCRLDPPPMLDPLTLQLSDIDRDGATDLLVALAGGIAIYWGLRGGDAPCSFTEVPTTSAFDNELFAATVLNADQDPTLEIAVLFDRGISMVHVNDRVPLLAGDPPIPHGSPPFSSGSMVSTDLDADGLADLIYSTDRTAHILTAKPGELHPKEEE